MVSALIDQDTTRWRKDVLDGIFFSFEVKNILSIPIPHYPQEDQLIWVGNKKGIFTVKSAYFLAREIIEKHERGESLVGDICAPLWKNMWHLNIPAKVRIFAWRLCMKAIPLMRMQNVIFFSLNVESFIYIYIYIYIYFGQYHCRNSFFSLLHLSHHFSLLSPTFSQNFDNGFVKIHFSPYFPK